MWLLDEVREASRAVSAEFRRGRLLVKRMLRPIWLAFRRIVLGIWPARRRTEPRREEIHHILIVRLDRLGDVVMTAALPSALHLLYPQAVIDIRVREPYIPLFESHPDVHQAFSSVAQWGDYDLVIDPVLDYPLYPAKQAAAVGGRWTLGFDVAGRGAFFSLPVMPAHADESFLASLTRLLRPLGFTGEVSPPRLYVSEVERSAARSKVGRGEFVVMHPGAFYASQRWPAASFAAVADSLLETGTEVVLIGSEGERALVQEVFDMIKHRQGLLQMCGEPLRMVMSVMAEASAALCNNSGPLHLAGALGVPTVSTLGPTNPVVWWPVGERQIVLKAPDCTHCERGDCPNRCLERILPMTVLGKIEQLLKRRDA